ncbi:hypothetical protein HOS53_gp051 [Klebsiella phage May]|uniref:Uncharacterized protein n=1 Tax=Klebsiella phage May TaxID=2054272 RepID=A0A2H5BP40_9CAUD|nr:hypothetical protein HOS53_gp051 [Klebsiella phage May]AUG88109.1 hypothetical protein CPT_May_195 [Klebsiella phage May]UJD04876.1 hypothetical protein PWKp5_00133 [Klebsiella phage PWKp5]
MITSGYSMDLYCDCDTCTKATAIFGSNTPSQYFGETYAECAKQAKQDGWYLSRDKRKCIAPGHKRS